MAVTIAQICDAIEDTLNDATSMATSQSYDELKEGIHSGDLPLIQIYPESNECAFGSGTDRTTFQGGVRNKHYIIHCDLYARQRSHLAEDMKKTVEMIDELETIFEQQNLKDYFGLDGIKAFKWSWTRSLLTSAEAEFYGARFIIEIWVF
jgi:hypothetical protein